MTQPLDEWSEDDKRTAVARAWIDPPLRGDELDAAIDDMTAWLSHSYEDEPT